MKIEVIDREGQSHSLDWTPGRSLMEMLRDSDAVLASCGGNCLCGTCHVYFAAAALARLPARSSEERERLEQLDGYKAESSRLSCQIPFSRDLEGAAIVLAPYE